MRVLIIIGIVLFSLTLLLLIFLLIPFRVTIIYDGEWSIYLGYKPLWYKLKLDKLGVGKKKEEKKPKKEKEQKLSFDIKSILKKLSASIRLSKLDIAIRFGLGDPFTTGMLYPHILTAFAASAQGLQQVNMLKTQPHLDITPVFEKQEFLVKGTVAFDIKLLKILMLAKEILNGKQQNEQRPE